MFVFAGFFCCCCCCFSGGGGGLLRVFCFFWGVFGFLLFGVFCGFFLQCIGFIHVLLIPELVISKIYVLTVLKFISYSYIIFSKVV